MKTESGETCKQVGTWAIIFGLGIIANGVVILLEALNGNYKYEETLRYYPNLEASQEDFTSLTKKWVLFAIFGILIGLIQVIGSVIIAKKVEAFVRIWMWVHFLVLFANLITIPFAMHHQLYIPRTGTVFCCLLALDVFFLFLGMALINKSLEDSRKLHTKYDWKKVEENPDIPI